MASSADDAAAIEQVRQMEADEEYARKVWQRESDRQQRRAERQQRPQQQHFFGTPQGPDGMIAPSASMVGQSGDQDARRTDRSEPYNPFRDPALVNVEGGNAPSVNGISSHQPSASAPFNARPSANATAQADGEKQWNTKEIYWQGRSQRIIIQNENGPCSLIALCNILLLRGTLVISPEDRPAVSYSYLSSLLGEHVVDAITGNARGDVDLEAALSILPQMQSGLDVNVDFSSIHGFAGQATNEESSVAKVENALDLIDLSEPGPSRAAIQKDTTTPTSTQRRKELELFKACQVALVHGWLADQADADTWEAVVVRAGNYDAALDRVVAGDELMKDVPNNAATAGGSTSDEDRLAASLSTLSEDDRRVVSDALVIRRFLETTATQLTYPGLLALSTTLARGQLYALFRNSHLSVLYRPTEEQLAAAASQEQSPAFSHGQPQLYQLVTDATLEIEDGIVWESIEDVDGSASRFFDGKFRPARLQGDFVGRNEQGDAMLANEDADFAYAQHLQQQEHMRAERHRRQQQQRRQQLSQSHRRQNSHSNNESQGLIARMLAKRKSSKSAPSPTDLQQNVNNVLVGQTAHASGTSTPLVTFAEPGSSSAEAATSNGTQAGSKKWWKKVF